MPPVKKYKRARHSTIDNYEVITNNCNELKMTLMFKKKSHSLELQKRSSSSVASSNEDRMSHSHRHRHRHHQVDSIANSKEFHRKSAVSSVQVRLPHATEKTSNDGLRRSLRVREKTLDLYEVKKDRETQKQSTKRKSCPISTSSSSKITRTMISKTTQGSSSFHTSRMNFKSRDLAPLRRKSHSFSGVQVDEVTKQKSATNSEFSSLNFTKRTVSKTTQCTSFQHPDMTLIPPTRKHTFSNAKENENIYPRFANIYHSQVALSLTQQRKSIPLFYPDGFQSQDKTFQRNNFYPMVDPLDKYCDVDKCQENGYSAGGERAKFCNIPRSYECRCSPGYERKPYSGRCDVIQLPGYKSDRDCRYHEACDACSEEYYDNYHRNAEKESAKRKWCLNSTSSSLKFTRRMVSKTMQGSNFNLDSMVSTPPRRKSHTSSATRLNDRTYPKFANVDPSQVVSGLTRKKIITKTSVSRTVISLFNLDAGQVESNQNIVYSSNEKGTPQYKFKEETVGMQYLSKKYPMMDPFTLDKCYGLSNGNIRKTEIMLQDVLAGKEVFPPQDFS